MQKELSETYRLQIEADRLSIQPYRRYKNKIIAYALLAVLAFALPQLVVIGHQADRLVLCLGFVFAGYAIYDLLFRVSLTYVFDQGKRQVYLKFPYLYTRKLMAFEDVAILAETVYGELHYVMSHQQNRYGRSYPISDYFTNGKKGLEAQAQYETEILAVIADFMAVNRSTFSL